MDIHIETPNFAPKQPLIDFVKERVSKLQHFDGKINAVNVWLKISKADHGENKVCELKLIAHGKDFFASKQYETFEEAVVRCSDAMEQQLKHFKEHQLS